MRTRYWDSDSDADASSAVVEQYGSPESDESILGRMFGGNANDTGWQLLQIYMSRSTYARQVATGAERIPCRFCLKKGRNCYRSDGPGEKCRACYGLCLRDPRGSLAFKHNFYSAAMVPPQLAMDNTITQQYRMALEAPEGSSGDEGDGVDDDDNGEERVVNLEDNYLEMEESEREDDEDSESFDYMNEGTGFVRPTRNEEILDMMSDGNVNDTGWRLLQLYMARRSDRHIASGAERIPCRFCLQKGLNYHRLGGPKQKCKSCRGSCSRDLRGALAFKHNTYKEAAAPELVMNNLHRRWLTKTLGQGPMSSTDDDHDEDEERVIDLEDNYLEIAESDEEGMGSIEGAYYGNRHARATSEMTNNEILASMFDDDPGDVGYQTLMWYLSRKRRPNLNGAVQIPCRRCLRANLRCHQYNGPDERCRQCAKARVRGCCDKDLRGAELYNGIFKE